MADELKAQGDVEGGPAGSSDARKTLAPDDSVMRTAVVGTCVILWVLAVFMILAANRIKAELAGIRSGLEFLMNTAGGASVNGVTVVGEDGKVVYTLRRPDGLQPETGTCAAEGCSGAEGACAQGHAPAVAPVVK